MSLKSVRQKKGLTQTELGEKVGVTRHYIGLLEAKQRNASSEIATKITKALKTNIATIFKATSESKKSFISK